MHRLLGTFIGLALMAAAAPGVYAYSRIKDITDIEGVRENQLVGYGLVFGLNGTGDSLRNAPGTQQSLQAMLERFGVNTRGTPISSGSVAAVIVTANLPAFATQGSRIDVTVSAMGDAKSLQGGTLLVTPLLGADGNAYAVAQGQITINGFSAQGPRAFRHPAALLRVRLWNVRSLLTSHRCSPSGSRCATPISRPPGAFPRRSTPSSVLR
jgi:flagellar P-ring protein precursor FlgI